jgi:regulator of replication initiation timing
MIDDIVVQNMEDKVIPKTEDIVIPKMEAFQVEEISEQEKLRIEYERMRSRMQKAIERRKRRSLKEEWEKLHNSRYNKKPSQEE